MYCDFFELRLPPFNNSPDPRFFFGTPDHKEALASLLYAAKERKGFVLITGEVGAGKTLLTRLLARRLDSRTDIAVVNNTNLHGRDLLATICQQFGLECNSQDGVAELSIALEQYLVDQYRRDRIVLLIIDEAQNLSVDSFEQLRMISNLEGEDAKLIQIMILGQPELKNTFQCPELSQLRQRIFRSFHLSGLTPMETSEYIRHRLRIAEAKHAKSIFDERAIERIYEYSRGIPRAINQICDNAMLSAFAQSKNVITRDIIDEVMSDMLSMTSTKTAPHLPADQVPAETATSPSRSEPAPTSPAKSLSPEYGPAIYPPPWMGGYIMPYTAPGPSNPSNSDRAERNLEKLIDRAGMLIEKFETICRELPQDVQRLERTHAQVVQACRQAEEQNASMAKHATRSQELSRINHEIFTQAEEQLSTLRETTEERLSTLRGTIEEQLSTLRETTEEQLGKLHEAIEEAAPLCLAIPTESERLAGMMRAHKAALKQVPRLSNDMKSLLETGNNQAIRLKSIIDEARNLSLRQNHQPNPENPSVIDPETQARLHKRLRESVPTLRKNIATSPPQ